MTPDKVLEDVRLSVNEAKSHYQIWWALVNLARPRFVGAMNRYPEFFGLSVVAHFDAMTTNVAHLFDKRKDSSSLYTYLSVGGSTLSKETIVELEARVAALAPVAKKVCTLRHKVVAHKDAAKYEEEVFEEAGVKPDEIRDLIEACGVLVEEICKANGWVNGVFSGNKYADATLGLLEAIEKG